MSEIYSGCNHELISSTVISPQDIVMDDSIAANIGVSSYPDDIRTIADTEITNAICGENIHSDSLTLLKSITDQSLNNDIDDRQEKIEQRQCIWSHIDTDFDPEEETANFGTRYALENDGKLFDVFTYATIEPKVSYGIGNNLKISAA